MNFIEQDIAIVSNLLIVAACWPPTYYEMKKPQAFFYYAWAKFLLLTGIVTLFGEWYSIYLVWSSGADIILLMESVTASFGGFLTCCKLFIMAYKKQELYDLIKHIEVVQSAALIKKSNEEVKTMKEKFYSEARLVEQIMLFIITVLLISYMAQPMYQLFFKGERNFPLPTAFPLKDDKSTPAYQILSFIELGFGIVIATIFIGVDGIFVSLALFACHHFKILKMELEVAAQLQDNSKSNEYLDKCVRHHNILYSFCKLLDATFAPMVLVTFVFSGLTLSFVGFQLMLTWGDLSKISLYLTFFIIISISLLWFCLYGEKITTEAASVGIYIFHTDWLNKDLQYKKKVLFIMARSQVDFYIYGYKFTKAILANFGKILNTAASYFTLLLSVSQPKAN